VISASIFSGSMVKSSGLMSQNTGVRLLRTMAWVVDAKLKGVVITSPVSSRAWMAISRAMCPFTNSTMFRIPMYSLSSFSSCLWKSPILVSHALSHMGFIISIYSS